MQEHFCRIANFLRVVEIRIFYRLKQQSQIDFEAESFEVPARIESADIRMWQTLAFHTHTSKLQSRRRQDQASEMYEKENLWI